MLRPPTKCKKPQIRISKNTFQKVFDFEENTAIIEESFRVFVSVDLRSTCGRVPN